MNKMISLSLLTISALYSAEIKLSPIDVEATIMTDVAHKAQTSADVAQALSDAVPSIDMSRRSGIANDVLIRGQKRDNISVEVDGTKVCGACPNRMDPPISHIVTNQIQTIEVIEGPYDVENFGTLSAGLKITTKKPTEKEQAEINVGFGSFGYKKFGASASGGTDRVRVSASVSTESSNQYKDGDGNTLAEQITNNYLSVLANPNATTAQKNKAKALQMQPQYSNIEAYSKKSAMAKAYIKTFEDQELRLGVTANRSTGVLYANTPMDAAYDDSNIYSVEYNIDNISDAYQNINLQYYHSDVDHPMDTKYRVAGQSKYKTNHLKTAMDGIKLKNSFNLSSYQLLVGLDASQRMWEGEYYDTNTSTGVQSNFTTSLPHTETTNQAIFATLEKSYGALDLEFGARYDYTKVKPDSTTKHSNDYTAFSANLMSTYNINKENIIFLGIGQASRVPDARELYIVPQGNENLEQVTNQEVDLGYEINNAMFKFKVKAFYSMLNDYIYYNTTTSTFQNVDAVVYGGELSASLYATDELTFDMGASYKRGTRDALIDQTGTNMADMAPLRGNIAANYEYMPNSTATLEVVASDTWDKYDGENGEQELAAWTIVNAKVTHAVNKQFDFTLGVNNIFDETYAQSNTYADLVLITAGGTDVMLLNEPGRYVYTNLDFKF